MRRQLERDRGCVRRDVELVIVQPIGGRDRVCVANGIGQREDGDQICIRLIKRDADRKVVALADIDVRHAEVIALAGPQLEAGRGVRGQQQRLAGAGSIGVHDIIARNPGRQAVSIVEQHQIAGARQDIGGHRRPPRHIDDEVPDPVGDDGVGYRLAVGVINGSHVGCRRTEGQRDRRRVGVGEGEVQLPGQDQWLPLPRVHAGAVVPDLQRPVSQCRFSEERL